MIYRLPESGDKDALREYLREHERYGEKYGFPYQDLFDRDYDGWLRDIHRNADEGNAEFGRSLFLLCQDGEAIVGILCIRYELPESLAVRYGHIGYGVRPACRRKGYATRMLRRALNVCAEYGLNEVIVGCFRDNTASAGVIRKCGGVLSDENDNFEKGRLSRYYRFDLHRTRFPD